LFEDLGDLDTATRLYLFALDHKDAIEQRIPRPLILDAIDRLAMIYKRQDDLQSAVALWEQAARSKHLEAFVELAKCYEHRLRSIPDAIQWTEAAIHLVLDPMFPPYERRQWLPELKHRLERLQRKNVNGSHASAVSTEPQPSQ
jgi:tetratricopeptide (TPR) repeat protein